MNTNEQYEPCFLEEATHARTATGEVYALYWSSALIGASDPRNRRIYLGDSTAVLARNFPTLGITPVRKAEVKPVEFVGVAEKIIFSSEEKNGVTYEHSKVFIEVPFEYEGKTFRCMEVQP